MVSSKMYIYGRWHMLFVCNASLALCMSVCLSVSLHLFPLFLTNTYAHKLTSCHVVVMPITIKTTRPLSLGMQLGSAIWLQVFKAKLSILSSSIRNLNSMMSSYKICMKSKYVWLSNSTFENVCALITMKGATHEQITYLLCYSFIVPASFIFCISTLQDSLKPLLQNLLTKYQVNIEF